MAQKKPTKKAAPVVAAPEKKADCGCGCGDKCTCGCGDKCACGCAHEGEVNFVRFISSIIIAAAVIVSPLIYGAVYNCGFKGKPSVRTDAGSHDKAIRNFIANNPKVIIDSVDAFYKKQQAAQRAAQPKVAEKAMIDEILNDKTNTVLGNPKGKFVIIEFFDYNCGYCKMMNKQLAEAIKKSKNIRWVLIDTPIFGEKSEIISRYAYAANKQGKFAKFHEEVGASTKLDEEGLIAIGKKIGLDTDKLKKDANSDEIKKKLADNRKYTQKLGMGGVPMFIINGNIQGGAFPPEQMEKYIKEANEMK